eukprot:42646-Pelagomonas_calceolata.AAC.1
MRPGASEKPHSNNTVKCAKKFKPFPPASLVMVNYQFLESKTKRKTAQAVNIFPTLNEERKRKRETPQAVKTLPASTKEKKIPRAEAPCIPFTKRNKKEVNGYQEGYQQ